MCYMINVNFILKIVVPLLMDWASWEAIHIYAGSAGLIADDSSSIKIYSSLYIYIYFPENHMFCLPSGTICHTVDIHGFSLSISQKASSKAASLTGCWHSILTSPDVGSSSNTPCDVPWLKLPVTATVQNCLSDQKGWIYEPV